MRIVIALGGNALLRRSDPMTTEVQRRNIMHESSNKPYDTVAYAFVGDCRFNMGRSLLVMGALMGSDVRLAGPAELHPPKDVVDIATDIADRTGARITITDNPAEAVSGVDFIHTDVWVSMGEPKDVWTERVKVLTPY